ncbi:MAG: RNAse III, ribonuclease III [Candidatus Moranbacteria bacterium GW2011_GWC1_45_18]|nr:MAG: Ribonuclease 3 [Candidatus Moranbacteria bacterium GW2011_GWC2_40_12]KKT33922.1 MAG: Ribonuclease 3 [Candidatus Moranbacteria bacterium GW2011_GWF2_44_10]KKT99821.1 MAG: RNAse III, ribonuclease III [Candidatus Moranbacteria bacterium GW2011_GWC1_45_18]OGI22647.1 MAG: ribonuclease III [Candidatus Moranbacteria bacterium RIFOXYA1_FULL_44_8]OGI34998.1 MAG: ribonuclease III [Candidatus Moranbacteria bacterium RIFOXYC1_FULL_44_8]OGI39562.1 MAG: ribonuclease III [Candidatus Moranbacteria bac
MTVKNIEELEKKIKIKLKNIDLLRTAVTHRSYINEHRSYKLDHNERLEFLGDAVLELVVTDYLYLNFPNPEGELTNWRAALVNKDMLSKVSRELGVEGYLQMSRGEAKDTGRAREYLLANAFEAIIGAIYLDRGYDAAKKFISENILSRLEEVIKRKLYIDPKSNFQEESQARAGITPNYRVISESGPDHDKKFIVGVYLEDEEVARGEGNSKQQAQREAARAGLEAKGW